MRCAAPTGGTTWLAVLGVLLCLGGCGGSSQTADEPAAEQAAMETSEPAAPPPMTTQQSELVDLAVTLAKAIEGSPDEAVSILAEKGLTPERWTTMMQDIAADPALSKAYTAAMEK